MISSLIERLERSLVTCLTSSFLQTKWHMHNLLPGGTFINPSYTFHFWVGRSRKLGTETKCEKGCQPWNHVSWYQFPGGLSPSWVMLQVRQELDEEPNSSTSWRMERTYQGAHSSNTQRQTKEISSALSYFSCFCLPLSLLLLFLSTCCTHTATHMWGRLYTHALWVTAVMREACDAFFSASSSMNQGCVKAMFHMK